jgi:hypothetical protein
MEVGGVEKLPRRYGPGEGSPPPHRSHVAVGIQRQRDRAILISVYEASKIRKSQSLKFQNHPNDSASRDPDQISIGIGIA